jgi:DUF971 family protein
VDDAIAPETIDVRRDEGVTITFLDGGVAELDLLTLRQGCPCAACRNKRDQGLDAWPEPNSPRPLRIDDARLHGGWALAFTWNDGHATGVYPFEALRRWSDGLPAFGPDSGLAGAEDADDGPDAEG